MTDKKQIPEEQDATTDEAFELGRIAGYNAGIADGWVEGFHSDPTGSYDGDIAEYGGNPYEQYRGNYINWIKNHAYIEGVMAQYNSSSIFVRDTLAKNPYQTED